MIRRLYGVSCKINGVWIPLPLPSSSTSFPLTGKLSQLCYDLRQKAQWRIMMMARSLDTYSFLMAFLLSVAAGAMVISSK